MFLVSANMRRFTMVSSFPHFDGSLSLFFLFARPFRNLDAAPFEKERQSAQDCPFDSRLYPFFCLCFVFLGLFSVSESAIEATRASSQTLSSSDSLRMFVAELTL